MSTINQGKPEENKPAKISTPEFKYEPAIEMILDLIQKNDIQGLISAMEKYPNIINKRYPGVDKITKITDIYGDEKVIMPFVSESVHVTNFVTGKTSRHVANSRFSILHWIVVQENVEMLNAVLDKFKDKIDINMLGSRVLTDMYGVNKNDRFLENVTPLYLAVRLNKNTDVLKCLLNHNADPALPDSYGTTPLLAGLNAKRDQHVNCLIDAKKVLSINAIKRHAPEDDKSTRSLALSCIVDGDQAMAIKLLSVPGINLDARDNHGMTTMQLAVKHKNKSVIDLLNLYMLAKDFATGQKINPDIVLDYLSLSRKVVSDLFAALKCQPIVNASRLDTLEKAIFDSMDFAAKNKLSRTSFFLREQKVPDVFTHEKMEAFNYLFNIAHAHKRSGNNQLMMNVIRQTAWEQFSHFTESLQQTDEKIQHLQWAKRQSAFVDHRHTIDVGRTATEKKIDAMIEMVSPGNKKSWGSSCLRN